MTTTPSETPTDSGDEAFGRALRRSFRWTTIVWLMVIVAGALVWFSIGDDGLIATVVKPVEAVVLAVASLLIAYGSLLPLKLSRDDRVSGAGELKSGSASRRTSRLVAGTMIRVLGTVALFLTCRYQMATPAGAIAAMTIGWYVLLTSIEVIVLARELPRPVGELSGTQSRLAGSASSLEV